MRRCLYLAMLVALVALVFAPAAMAQQMGDDKMMGEGTMMSSASSPASAMSNVSSSASAMSEDQMMSASAMGDNQMMSPSASSSASALPGTGGPPLLPLISAAALVLIMGSWLLAATVVRRSS